MANFYQDCDFQDNEEGMQKIDAIVGKALELGINYFDTSPWYGRSEEYLGKTLGKRPRNSYFIGTKAGRYFSENIQEWFDFSYDRIIQSVETSIKRLNCEYIDLIQVQKIA